MVLAIPPSGTWRQAQGLWSVFNFHIGSYGTAVPVLFSTNLPIHYVIWDQSESKSWQADRFGKVSNEHYLGYDFDAAFGDDIVTICPWAICEDAALAKSRQRVASSASPDPFDYYSGMVGSIGLYPQSEGAGHPSSQLLSTLKSTGAIASLSWGYTAGSFRRLHHASLTLGGYDQAKMGRGVSYTMANDVDHFLTARLSGFAISARGYTAQYLSTSISITLDSNLPYMWLPVELCELIANRLHLTYDAKRNIYLSASQDNARLYQEGTELVFSFTQPDNPSQVVQISSLYYEWWWYWQSPHSETQETYFPMKRAANPSQYVLGRMFFQNAYITADFERRTFTLAQRIWTNETNLMVIQPAPPHHRFQGIELSNRVLSGLAIAGLVLAGLNAIVLILLIIFLVRRDRQKRREGKTAEVMNGTVYNTPEETSPLLGPVS